MKLIFYRFIVLFLFFQSGYSVSEMNSEQTLTITSFDAPSKDLDWRIVNDGVMGGRSSSDFELSEGLLRFFGVLNTNGGGFASIRSAWTDFGLAPYTHIDLRVRGDGRTYTLLLRSKNSRISYRMDFSTVAGQWQELSLAITDFRASWRGRVLNQPPIDPASIDQIGIMLADGRDGGFTLEVDSLRAQAVVDVN